MRISIELFLADNMMMNYLILRLACVFGGFGVRQIRLLLGALFGAAYALVTLAWLPVLQGLFPKLLLCLVMTFPVVERMRAVPKAFLCLLLSACLMGGVMFGLLQLFGGEFYYGAYVCTVPVRMALLGLCVCACLPRLTVGVLAAVRARSLHVQICIRFDDRVIELSALSDSGNLLTEPISGLPVVVVRPGLLPKLTHTRPVAYRTVGGTGVLLAARPKALMVYQGYWKRVDAVVAESTQILKSADAILPAVLLTEEGWYQYAKTGTETAAGVSKADPKDYAASGQTDPVYPFGGNAAGTVCTAGGAGVDRQTYE